MDQLIQFLTPLQQFLAHRPWIGLLYIILFMALLCWIDHPRGEDGAPAQAPVPVPTGPVRRLREWLRQHDGMVLLVGLALCFLLYVLDPPRGSDDASWLLGVL
jgi:hypothetical protein